MTMHVAHHRHVHAVTIRSNSYRHEFWFYYALTTFGVGWDISRTLMEIRLGPFEYTFWPKTPKRTA